MMLDPEPSSTLTPTERKKASQNSSPHPKAQDYYVYQGLLDMREMKKRNQGLPLSSSSSSSAPLLSPSSPPLTKKKKKTFPSISTSTSAPPIHHKRKSNPSKKDNQKTKKGTPLPKLDPPSPNMAISSPINGQSKVDPTLELPEMEKAEGTKGGGEGEGEIGEGEGEKEASSNMTVILIYIYIYIFIFFYIYICI